jgi:UDP:flavonoid glycosyltransferase YjiC (YdhE family)
MKRPLRILVLGTSAGGGDWPPLVAAAVSLAEAGHEIAYLGDEGLARATAETGLTIETVSPGRDLPARMRDWQVARLQNPATPIPILDWVDDVAPRAVERAKSLAPDLLLCSNFTAPLGIRVREEVRTPMCLINATYYLGPGSPRRLEEDFAPGATEAQGFAQLIQSGDLVLHATDAQFDPPPKPIPRNHHWVGTLIWEPAQEPPPWLAEPGDPWALVTLSSERQENEIELARAAIGALASFPLRTLVTLADPQPREELGAQAANVRVETFVPHSPVLERAALCVAHAGHGIVAKALQFGVPMVLVPWDRDQPGVAARAEALGVARVVARDALTPETLAAAIREVLEGPEYARRARYHRERLRAESPASSRVCELVTAFMSKSVAIEPG